jgi:putative intracellular protease/amidase
LGGRSPLEPRALKWPLLDASARAWLNDPRRMALLNETARPDDIDPADFDVIYFTGGHAVMWDIPDSAGLQAITRTIWERGGIVSAVCHGYCSLLNVRLRTGVPLVAGRKLTGFSWNEEVLAGVAKYMPYNAEAEMKKRGARYEKALLPFVTHVVADGRLVTGQNPFSAKATAHRIVELLYSHRSPRPALEAFDLPSLAGQVPDVRTRCTRVKVCLLLILRKKEESCSFLKKEPKDFYF